MLFFWNFFIKNNIIFICNLEIIILKSLEFLAFIINLGIYFLYKLKEYIY